MLFRSPYRTIIDKGSDVQGGNNPFDPFLTGKSAEELDLAFLALTGYDGIKPTKSITDKFGITWKSKARKDIDVTLNPTEVSNIFYSYSKDVKNGDAKTDAPKDFDKALLKENGGRIENRKYLKIGRAHV